MEEIVEAFALNSYLESFYRRKCHRFLVDFDRHIGTAHTEANSYIHFRIADSCNSDSTGTDALPGQVDHVKVEPLWRNAPKLKYLLSLTSKSSPTSSHWDHDVTNIGDIIWTLMPEAYVKVRGSW